MPISVEPLTHDLDRHRADSCVREDRRRGGGDGAARLDQGVADHGRRDDRRVAPGLVGTGPSTTIMTWRSTVAVSLTLPSRPTPTMPLLTRSLALLKRVVSPDVAAGAPAGVSRRTPPVVVDVTIVRTTTAETSVKAAPPFPSTPISHAQPATQLVAAHPGRRREHGRRRRARR